MTYSNRSVAWCISKALFNHRRAAATSAPFSAATALNRLHERRRNHPSSSAGATLFLSYMKTVGLPEESGVDGVQATGSIRGEGKSRVEVAYDATKGRAEMVKDTVIAEANENGGYGHCQKHAHSDSSYSLSSSFLSFLIM